MYAACEHFTPALACLQHCREFLKEAGPVVFGLAVILLGVVAMVFLIGSKLVPAGVGTLRLLIALVFCAARDAVVNAAAKSERTAWQAARKWELYSDELRAELNALQQQQNAHVAQMQVSLCLSACMLAPCMRCAHTLARRLFRRS